MFKRSNQLVVETTSKETDIDSIFISRNNFKINHTI